jgi:translocation and assembly module TamB
VRLVADGKLALNGPMASHPRLSGRIDVRSLDVNIPDQLPGSLQATQVRHVNVPDADKAKLQTPQTKAQARRDAQKNKTKAAPMVIDLDLTLAAPARVFVRGRGIEAELGGVLKLGGTTDSPTTNGGFDLKHGRLDIGERRLNFSRGKIYFRGSTDPELDLIADSQSADVTATVHVTGHASEPKIEFSSTPALPEDEILARLLFGKPAGSLTPGQAVQVARTIAQFSGGGGHQLDDVRRSLGISSLDIGTGENGGGQVGIGKRLNDNVYLGVSQGTASDSGQVSVDIDITRNIKVQGKGGATGGEIGIGAQWDY